MGLTGNLLKWIMDFLNGRTQRTRVGAAYSEAIAITSGIVQGSCIVLILFVIMLMMWSIALTRRLFAVYTLMISSCIHSVFERLQLAIDRLVSWANKWQLRIAINKCTVSHVGNNSIPPYTYSIQSLPLPNVVTAVKDLGVMFDVKLKFNVHINKIVVNVLAQSNLIIQCFLSSDPKTLFFWHLQRM